MALLACPDVAPATREGARHYARHKPEEADGAVPTDIDLGAHVPDRDVIPHDLETYDAQR